MRAFFQAFFYCVTYVNGKMCVFMCKILDLAYKKCFSSLTDSSCFFF